MERTVTSRKAKKIEKIIIAIIYIIVIVVAIYFILATFFPNYILSSSNTYQIKASDSKIFNTLSSFYIDNSGVLGDKQIVNDTTLRPITLSNKFNFVFRPTKNLPNDTNATFYVDLVLNQSNPGSCLCE